MDLEKKKEQLQQELKEMGDLLASQRQEAMEVSVTMECSSSFLPARINTRILYINYVHLTKIYYVLCITYGCGYMK